MWGHPRRALTGGFWADSLPVSHHGRPLPSSAPPLLASKIRQTFLSINMTSLWLLSGKQPDSSLIMVERSDRMWSTGEGNGKPLQYSCLENPMNSMKRQKDRTLKNELPRLVGAQHATGDQWRNNSRKNEGMEPKKNNTQLLM